jgi:Uma2 family endonuclease
VETVMLDKARRRMTPEEFYAWQETIDERYELVDGHPVLRTPDMEMMTGASRRHDQIVVNAIGELSRQLRGTDCRPFSADTAVRTVGKTRRRPDAGVECGELDDESHEAGEVRLVVEVLSPSTRELDMFGKLDEYKSIASLDHILLIEPNAPKAILWSRAADGSWEHATFEGLDVAIEMPGLGLRLKVADLYSGLTFRPAPKLVEGGGA